MKKKTGWVIAVVVIVLAAAGFAGWWFFLRGGSGAAKAEGDVYVDQVRTITGQGTRPEAYAGVVQAQKTLDIDADSSKQVAEIYVEAGQEVKEGDPLFSYDREQIDLTLQSAQLEYEGIGNEIAMYQNQITEWQKQTRKDTPEYLLGLQDLELKVRTAQYNLTLKESQIHQIEKSLENITVYSSIDGTVKSVNENASQSYDGQTHFISILQTGNYHIQCKVSEMGIYSLYEGMPVKAVSRVDASQTWSGYVERIDRENTAEENPGMYYGPDKDGGASYYYFYVVLDNFDGLMLGQHLFVRPDDGVEPKTGLWLSEDYLMIEDDGKAFVWAEKNGRIEKRAVTLGEYDEEWMEYEITDGLTADDYIAWPDETVAPGMNALHYSDAVIGGGVRE